MPLDNVKKKIEKIKKKCKTIILYKLYKIDNTGESLYKRREREREEGEMKEARLAAKELVVDKLVTSLRDIIIEHFECMEDNFSSPAPGKVLLLTEEEQKILIDIVKPWVSNQNMFCSLEKEELARIQKLERDLLKKIETL